MPLLSVPRGSLDETAEPGSGEQSERPCGGPTHQTDAVMTRTDPDGFGHSFF